MPLVALTATEALRRPIVKYNAADGSGREYGMRVENFPSTRPAAPSAPTLAASTTGGTLTGTTAYTFVVTAVNDYGVESLPSTGVTSTSGAGSTNKVTVTLATTAGIVLYNIYGRTSGTEQYIATVDSSSTTVYVDTGSVTPSGAKPSAPLTTGTVVLRNRNVNGSSRYLPRVKTVVATPATTSSGIAGQYEYRRA